MFPDQNFVSISHSYHACYMPSPSQTLAVICFQVSNQIITCFNIHNCSLNQCLLWYFHFKFEEASMAL
jgi:hypothetical protein